MSNLIMNNEFLFVEKYRPQKIEECVYNYSLINIFIKMVNSHIVVLGYMGCGKTTVSNKLKAIWCNLYDDKWF